MGQFLGRRLVCLSGGDYRPILGGSATENGHSSSGGRGCRRAAFGLLNVPGKHCNGAYNLVHSSERAVDIALRVSKIIPADIHIQRDKRDARHYRIAAARARDLLRWKPFFSVDAAIEDNLQWFNEGHVKDWQSPIFWNVRRMAATVKEGTR